MEGRCSKGGALLIATTVVFACWLATLAALVALKLTEHSTTRALLASDPSTNPLLSFTPHFSTGLKLDTAPEHPKAAEPKGSSQQLAKRKPQKPAIQVARDDTDTKDKKKSERKLKQLPGDLPQLSPDRSPESVTWDNSVAICACMLKENVTDVREWLLYHRWLGVDHVYLAENGRSEDVSDEYSEQVKDLVDAGFLTLYAVKRPKGQMTIYRECMEEHYHQYNWVSFIDLDEYIVMRHPHTYPKDESVPVLKQFLDSHKRSAAVAIHWVMFGSNRREERPVGGGVLQHYTRCNKTPIKTVKVIVNTWFALHDAGQPHNFIYRDNMPAVDENSNPLAWRTEATKGCKSKDTVTKGCRRVPHKYEMENKTVEHIALFHYAIKSKEDFNIKLNRGNGFTRDWRFFDSTNKYANEKGGICQELHAIAQECCSGLTLPKLQAALKTVEAASLSLKSGAAASTGRKRPKQRKTLPAELAIGQ